MRQDQDTVRLVSVEFQIQEWTSPTAEFRLLAEPEMGRL